MARKHLQEPASPQIRVLDLFSGAGGFAAGFHAYTTADGERPFVTAAAVEFDKAAASTYAANFPEAHVHAGDIADFDPEEYKGKIDVIVGGPPCQGFSGLGKEDPDDPRNELWRQYMRIVTALKPKLFVIENVDRFFRSQQFEDLKAAVREGELVDYEIRPAMLNAADYGVPQARRRAIVIATLEKLGDPLEHPGPSHDKRASTGVDEGADAALFPVDGGNRRPWVPVSTVFEETAKQKLLPQMPAPRVGTPLVSGVPGPYVTTDLHFGRNPEDLSRARYQAIPPEGNRNDLRGKWFRVVGGKIRVLTTEQYERLGEKERDEARYLSTTSWDNHNKGSGDVMGRLRAGEPSVTIRTEFYKPEKGRYLHPTDDRPITHYEAARIQGFPEDFTWYGTKIQIARQIGNAVPVGLGKALAAAIHAYLTGRS
ncbi:DNA cytosine methyltransferase [Actinacidiphila glaucinigra]|uniref:DNA cytosine methyltransferase n=1 Tax=Actinacidiphila glaucinigra TaxID=235986 RepID=UPI0038056D87